MSIIANLKQNFRDCHAFGLLRIGNFRIAFQKGGNAIRCPGWGLTIPLPFKK